MEKHNKEEAENIIREAQGLDKVVDIRLLKILTTLISENLIRPIHSL